MIERRAAMSELIWEVAVAYDWRLSVKNHVLLARWMAAQNRVTRPGLSEALVRLGIEPPRGLVAALCRHVMDYDRKRLSPEGGNK